MASTLDAMVEATPADRDRVVDFLRAASICAVVVGHWSIAIVWWDHGVLRVTSAIGVTSWLWLATWVLQVMPIFFFVGGFSNLVSFDAARRRGETSGAFIRSRLDRLLRPSLVFFAVWGSIELAMHLLNVGAPTGPHLWGSTTLLRGFNPPGATLPFGPLWFLAVYLVVIALAPWLIGL
ncbi:MAG TPA: acyltransferase family protein, partial [Actinomycetota bacterium]|nr:acyltransferase family protein [Actinomycetota bacterium]